MAARLLLVFTPSLLHSDIGWLQQAAKPLDRLKIYALTTTVLTVQKRKNKFVRLQQYGRFRRITHACDLLWVWPLPVDYILYNIGQTVVLHEVNCRWNITSELHATSLSFKCPDLFLENFLNTESEKVVTNVDVGVRSSRWAPLVSTKLDTLLVPILLFTFRYLYSTNFQCRYLIILLLNINIQKFGLVRIL